MNDDVRMRGFLHRTEVDEAVRLVDERVGHLDGEWISILEAGGRVLAHDMTARQPVPAFRRSAMDGFAVVAEDTFGATPDDPRPFTIVGESLPALPATATVEAGTCVRIMTGAPLPDGADAVVPVEQAVHSGDACNVTAPVTPGRHVSDIGEDIEAGTVVLRAGRRLRPQDLGVLSSLGRPRVPVMRRPSVALITTGNELLPAGSAPRGFLVVDANTPMLRALVDRDGGRLLTGPIVRDDKELMREALAVSVRNADCVLVTGGSSVGMEDHAPTLVRELGELPVHGIAMRPSSPAGIGFIDDTPVFLLPGNPVSSLCAYDFFAGRAVRRLAGRHADWPHTVVRMPLGRKIASVLGRTDYVRVRIEDGSVVPLMVSGAAILSSTTRAHGFVIVPAQREGFAENTPVDVRLY